MAHLDQHLSVKLPWIDMHQVTIRIVIAIYLIVASVSGSDSLSQCSCYMIYGNSSDWENSRNLCKAIGGDLVSIETLEEWNFINNQLKGKTIDSGADQWWIGLVRTNRQWKWLSNHTLEYEKWTPNLDVNEKTHIYAVIEKGKGLFWKTRKDLESRKICESKRKDCATYQIRWCDNTLNITTVKPTQQTTVATSHGISSTTKAAATIATTTNKLNKLTYTARTTQQKTTKGMMTGNNQDSNSTEREERSFKPKKKPFPILIVVIVLSIILLACIGILILVWIRKSKRKGTHRISQRRNHDNVVEVPLSVRHMYDQYPHEDKDKRECLSSQDEPGFTYFTKNKNTTVHHVATTKTEKTAPKIVQVDAQLTQPSGVGNGNVAKRVEVAGNDGNNTKEESKNNTKQLHANRVDTKTCSGDEFEDEVFYPDENPEENPDKELDENLDENPNDKPNENASQQNSAQLDSADQDTKSVSNNTVPLYATIDKSKKYDKIDDVSAKGDQPTDITYAELSEFQSNSSEPLKKPTPYYPTEYASVTVHPLSPRPFER